MLSADLKGRKKEKLIMASSSLSEITQAETLSRLPKESATAYEAFIDYAELGASRSLAALCRLYCGRSGAKKRPPTTRLNTLKAWSSKFRWQERLMDYMTEVFDRRREKMLLKAEKLDEAFDHQILELQKLRITRRGFVDDPRDMDKPADQRRKIESITLKLNTSELAELVRAFGQLNKDVNAVMGVPNKVDVSSNGKPVAWPTFITVAGDDNAPLDEPSALPELSAGSAWENW
jgi:hypothetical protein